MIVSIWWIRRDLRLTDNPALSQAQANSTQVIPLYILDPGLLNSSYVGEIRLAFLYQGLRGLDASLRERGSYLVVRHGKPQEILSLLLEETGAAAIYAEPDYSPYASQRDSLISAGLPIRWIGSPAVYPPGSVLKPDGTPYTVFTPFSRAWKALPGLVKGSPLSAPDNISTPPNLATERIPEHPTLPVGYNFPPGEVQAQKRLRAFTSHGDPPLIFGYDNGRNLLDTAATSGLSPYLRFGMLSARQAALTAIHAIDSSTDPEYRKGAETWLNELIWRDFYIHILHHFPHVRHRNFRLQNVAWENDQQNFDAWCKGATGYPVVDAAMRQLSETGWMHNRARMIVASFLTKDLLIDWRWGERWFMQHLVDGDPASNNGGWQWTAGTGTDAAPYFRIFNPTSQALKFDPHGSYVRRWLPELRKLPGNAVHQPWNLSAEMQTVYGFRLGQDYPDPIIDHAWARQRALHAYAQAK